MIGDETAEMDGFARMFCGRSRYVVMGFVDEVKYLPANRPVFRVLVKRILDFSIALVGLIVLSPLLAAIFVVLRMTIGRPVLFFQDRPGLQGEKFRIIKFCTMTGERDAEGKLLSDELRLTRLGRFLRSSSLDELPELWNVLRGEMSLVGPRPLLTEYLQYYTPEESRRHDVRPGMTGWAQIQGRNALSWEEKFRLDVWYVDHWSLGLDAKILAKTVWMVLTRKGISAAGHATMPAFFRSAQTDRSAPTDGPVQTDRPTQTERANCEKRHA